MQVGYKKIAIFYSDISLHRVLSTVGPSDVINTVLPDRGKLVTLIGGVCVQHSSEGHVSTVLWSSGRVSDS